MKRIGILTILAGVFAAVAASATEVAPAAPQVVTPVIVRVVAGQTTGQLSEAAIQGLDSKSAAQDEGSSQR